MPGPGRPATTVLVCQELRALLLEQGFPPGTKVPRPIWDEYVGKAVGVSYPQARNITATGKMNGYWDVLDSQGRVPGSVVIKGA